MLSYKISEVHAFWNVREVVRDIMRTIGVLFLADFLLVFIFLVKVLHKVWSGVLLHICCVHS